ETGSPTSTVLPLALLTAALARTALTLACPRRPKPKRKRVALPPEGDARLELVLTQTGSINVSDNEAVRLIHRERLREDSLEEGECYDHSYREHASDHVEVVRLEPAGIRVEIAVEVEAEHHVTTERLKVSSRSDSPHGLAVRAALGRSLK